MYHAQGQKVVISDIIDIMSSHAHAIHLLKIPQMDLITAFQKQPTLSTTNLYRKQYGNLKEMFNKEHRFLDVFSLDGDQVCLRDVGAAEAAAKTGLISSAVLAKIVALHKGKAVHDAETLKTNHENECVTCHAQYKELLNTDTNALCTKPTKGKHKPMFDWTKNANDVLACKIAY